MPARRLAHALLVLALTVFAAPAAGQGGGPPSPDAAAPVETTVSADAKAPAFFPPPCLACGAARKDVGWALDAEALPRGVAPLIGGVVGAVAGLVATRIACANRSCEMADLGGILGGAVIGVAIGKEIEGMLPGRRRW